MPIFDYECCGTRIDVLVDSQHTPPLCGDCGREMRRIPSAPVAHFKGAGFHVNDYGRYGCKSSQETARHEDE